MNRAAHDAQGRAQVGNPGPGTAYQFGSAQSDKLIAAYLAGSKAYQLGDQFAIDRRTVSKILTRNCVQTKHPALTDVDIDQAIRLYVDGWIYHPTRSRESERPEGIPDLSSPLGPVGVDEDAGP